MSSPIQSHPIKTFVFLVNLAIPLLGSLTTTPGLPLSLLILYPFLSSLKPLGVNHPESLMDLFLSLPYRGTKDQTYYSNTVNRFIPSDRRMTPGWYTTCTVLYVTSNFISEMNKHYIWRNVITYDLSTLSHILRTIYFLLHTGSFSSIYLYLYHLRVMALFRMIWPRFGCWRGKK